MAYDKNLPDGDKAGNLLDNDSRANFSANEDIISAEHTMVTGGNQDGRHKFMVDTEANIAAESEFVAGALAFATDVCADIVPTIFDGTDWFDVLTPYLSNVNDWVAGQINTQNGLTPGANISSDWADSNVFTVTLDQNSTLDNPSNQPDTGKGGVWYYIVTNGATPYTLAYGNKFTADGVTMSAGPVINATANSVTVIHCTQNAAGDIMASEMLQGVGGFDATAQDGYFVLAGTGILVQWIKVTMAAGPGIADYDWATAFASDEYVVVASAGELTGGGAGTVAGAVSAYPLDDDTVHVVVVSASAAVYIHLIAIGLAP